MAWLWITISWIITAVSICIVCLIKRNMRQAARSVSYTHLDVYKRQGLYHCRLWHAGYFLDSSGFYGRGGQSSH